MIAALPNSLSIQCLKRESFFTALQIAGASLFLALCAQISLPLTFSPIPLTGQTFGVMLIGATMGSRKGVLAVLAYLMEGCCGLPVFSGGGFGLMRLLGPAGGYLVGCLFQAYFIGWFAERQALNSGPKIVLLLLLSCAIQMGLGVLGLSFFVGFNGAVTMGLYPFVAGEILKALALAGFLSRSRAAVQLR